MTVQQTILWLMNHDQEEPCFAMLASDDSAIPATHAWIEDAGKIGATTRKIQSANDFIGKAHLWRMANPHRCHPAD